MNFKKKTLIVFKVFISFLLINLFGACTGKLLSYRGGWVDEENRISLLEGGPHKGIWETRDLSVEYEYQLDTKNLQISGVVELANYISNGFSALDHLNLYIHFLDANGIVLDTKGINIFGFNRFLAFLEEMSFNRRLDLSEDTVAVAFSYRGKVTEGGSRGNSRGGERIDWEFWKMPHRNPPK